MLPHSVNGAAAAWTIDGFTETLQQGADTLNYSYQETARIVNAIDANGSGVWHRDGGAQRTVEQTYDNKHYKHWVQNQNAWR